MNENVFTDQSSAKVSNKDTLEQNQSESSKGKEEVVIGNYFIIDWAKINPMKPNEATPFIVVANATEEEFLNMKSGKIEIPRPIPGTKYRIVLKVVQLVPVER